MQLRLPCNIFYRFNNALNVSNLKFDVSPTNRLPHAHLNYPSIFFIYFHELFGIKTPSYEKALSRLDLRVLYLL